MGFAKFLGKVAGDIKNAYSQSKKEAQERIEFEQKEIDRVDNLLDKFEYPELEDLCKAILGKKLEDEIVQDKDNEEETILKPTRRKYLDHIWENLKNQEIKFSQIEAFALKHKIIYPNFHASQSTQEQDKKEFENIVNSIRLYFQPEKITKEEHLQAQLTIFLKTKFPEKKIEREFTSKSGDILDIIVDGKYVLELKVPKNKTHLRNLSAQIDEYVVNYPNLCVVIADTSKMPNEDDEEPIEPKLSENIREYVDKYKVKYGVPSIIFNIELRK